VRLVAAMLLVAVVTLSACGGSTVTSSPPASSSPTATPGKPTNRDLNTSEHVALSCGLSLTVPARYRGWYYEDASGTLGSLDVVGSSQRAQQGLMESFSVRSMTPAGKETAPFGWPLIGVSNDQAIEVRCAAVRLGTAKAVETIAVIVRLPGRPTGLVTMWVFGKEASGEPTKVMAQVDSMWTLFSVQGAPLPIPSK
jgi:hypothetical protein